MWARWTSTLTASSISANTGRDIAEATQDSETDNLSSESVMPGDSQQNIQQNIQQQQQQQQQQQ